MVRFHPLGYPCDMVNLCNIQSGHFVLEPSAGEGALAFAANKIDGAEIRCVELNARLCQKLSTHFMTKHGDFLRQTPPKLFVGLARDDFEFDRVLMNPPSKDNEYILHVMQAERFLKRGGRLVALIVNRFIDGHSNIEQLFRDFLGRMRTTRIYGIDEPCFVIDDNPVGAELLVFDKP